MASRKRRGGFEGLSLEMISHWEILPDYLKKEDEINTIFMTDCEPAKCDFWITSIFSRKFIFYKCGKRKREKTDLVFSPWTKNPDDVLLSYWHHLFCVFNSC